MLISCVEGVPLYYQRITCPDCGSGNIRILASATPKLASINAGNKIIQTRVIYRRHCGNVHRIQEIINPYK
jgi:hypothetical protein